MKPQATRTAQDDPLLLHSAGKSQGIWTEKLLPNLSGCVRMCVDVNVNVIVDMHFHFAFEYDDSSLTFAGI